MHWIPAFAGMTGSGAPSQKSKGDSRCDVIGRGPRLKFSQRIDPYNDYAVNIFCTLPGVVYCGAQPRNIVSERVDRYGLHLGRKS